MAIITQNRLWNGIQTKQEINTETGVIEVFAINSGLFGIDEKIARKVFEASTIFYDCSTQ